VSFFVNCRKLRPGDTFYLPEALNAFTMQKVPSVSMQPHTVIDRIGSPNSSRYRVLCYDGRTILKTDLKGKTIQVVNRIDETESDPE
jgi:hypothetical protein